MVDSVCSSSSKHAEGESFGLGSCESVSNRYEGRHRIGEGTYGIIYRATDRITGRMVALKRLLPHNECQDGFPLTSLRA